MGGRFTINGIRSIDNHQSRGPHAEDMDPSMRSPTPDAALEGSPTRGDLQASDDGRIEAEFFSVVGHQRAHRRLRPDPVDERLLRRVLEAAVRAPSAENRQPWEFIVVRSPEIRTQIGLHVRLLWQQHARKVSEQRLPKKLFADVDSWATAGLARAPVLVVVCGNLERCDTSSLGASIFPAVQNLLLAATALGLGSLLSTLPTLGGTRLAEILALPDHVKPLALIPLGWPETQLPIAKREPIESKLHFDRFGSRGRCP
jgi:nitroreductase